MPAYSAHSADSTRRGKAITPSREALTPRRPKQARSRARMEAILDAAEQVVAVQGMARLTMSEVALRAGVSIGSLYQYIPTPQALLRALTDRFLADLRSDLEHHVGEARTPQAFADAISQVIWGIYAKMRDQPQQREIWAHLAADRDLAALNLADSRENAEGLVAALVRVGVVGRGDAAALLPDVLLITHLSGSAVQMAADMPVANGDKIVACFVDMVLARLGLPGSSQNTVTP